MKEREGNQVQIRLFDELPPELKSKEDLIKETFDGSLGTQGITMVLNPLTGDVISARLIDLQTGKVASYEPLVRGKWTNFAGDLREDSIAYQKLDTVYEDVHRQYKLWRQAVRLRVPMREWTTTKARKLTDPYNTRIISPEEWYKKVINPEEDEYVEEKPRVRTTHKRLPRPRTGRVKSISSKDEKSAKPATTNHRRNADRAIQRARRTI